MGLNAYEIISLPKLGLAMIALAILYGYPTPAAAVAQKAAGVCQSKYCGPREMFVDTPLNTLLKDQSLGAGLSILPQLPSATAVNEGIKSDLRREQQTSVGVNMMAMHVR